MEGDKKVRKEEWMKEKGRGKEGGKEGKNCYVEMQYLLQNINYCILFCVRKKDENLVKVLLKLD